ncbi:MAG: type II secretion system F family protein [Burkholderiaceae bacterium]|nr:type II secretion system F family protein [Burkholderiaceae bacterium]
MIENLKTSLQRLLPATDPYPGIKKAIKMLYKRRAKFYGDLADALADGANPYELFKRRAERARQRRDPMAPLYARWRDRAQRGNLRQTFDQTLPAEDLLVISAGERGDLPAIMRFLAQVVTKRDASRQAIKKAVAGPAFIFLMITAIQIGVAVGMMPIMVEIMPPEQFPAAGALLYTLSNFIVNYWYLIYGLPIALTVAVVISLPRWSGRWRRRIDTIAPYSIYRDVRAAELLVSLAAMMQAKTSMFDAIAMMAQGSSPWMRSHLMRMRASLRSDRSLIKAVDTGIFGPELLDRVMDYSERSNFERGIAKIGLTTIDEVSAMINARAGVARNALMILAGAFLVLTVMGMMSIGYEAGEVAQRMMMG